MKKTQAKKKAKSVSDSYEIIELPSDNVGMKEFVDAHREEINGKIVNNIHHAISKRLDAV